MKKIFALLTFAFIISLVGCYTPSPLYGGWSDNLGNKISLADDGTFNATILVGNAQRQYSGTYTVMENVLIFSTSEGTVVTEWDLRGSILYIQWTAAVDGGNPEILNLVLYHTS